jgi:hypothetical protein
MRHCGQGHSSDTLTLDTHSHCLPDSKGQRPTSLIGLSSGSGAAKGLRQLSPTHSKLRT